MKIRVAEEYISMADLILIVFGAVGSFGILIYVMIIAYQAKGSRPVIMELSQANTEKSAKTVELKPYMETISKQFPATLGF